MSPCWHLNTLHPSLSQVTASLSSGDNKGTESQEANGSVPAADGDKGATEQNQRTFHFVIKSPPKASFIKAMHKLTKPFLNEVTWYLVSMVREMNVECLMVEIVSGTVASSCDARVPAPRPLQLW